MGRVGIAELTHKVKLCRQTDVVTTGGTMVLARADIIDTWAAIEVKRGSMYGPGGVIIAEDRDVRSHIVTLRYRTDLDIRSSAWLYEERRRSLPRWYKVLKVAEDGESFVLDVRLVEASEDAVVPVAQSETCAPAEIRPRDLPASVKL